MDEDGFLYFVDRMKEMIISGGENIFSAEVEDVLNEIPEVVEAGAIGIPDEKWGEVVHAIVRLRDGEKIEEAAIIAHCHEQIAGFKCPKSVSFRYEPMPLSGAGKILKTDLRKPYWEAKKKTGELRRLGYRDYCVDFNRGIQWQSAGTDGGAGV